MSIKSADEAKRLRAFLRDLSRLSDKYGFRIGGCGCDGSPYIYRVRSDGGGGRSIAYDLRWDREKYAYEADYADD